MNPFALHLVFSTAMRTFIKDSVKAVCAERHINGNPVVRSETTYNANNYALAFRRSGKIRFVVPEFGYVEPPLQTTEGRLGLFNDKGDVPCVFDVSACNPNRRISMAVAKAGESDALLYVTDNWLAKTRAALPEGGRLTVKGNSLVFTYGNDGMVVVFR